MAKRIIVDSAKDLAVRGAELIVSEARKSVSLNDRFSIGLSGGGTPRAMHRLLSVEPFLSELIWDKMHIFWVDERCVSSQHTESNYGNARRDFLDSVPLAQGNIHPMPGEVDPERGAEEYGEFLFDFFRPSKDEFPAFDILFLGLGTDGHTASLFPGHDVLNEKKRPIRALSGGDPSFDRLTMTLPVINSAKKIVFTVSGKSKAGIVKEIFDSLDSVLPASMVKPYDGELIWLLDSDAVSLLS